jgi:flagellar motor switch protein FliM
MEKDKFLSQKEIDALLSALPKDGSLLPEEPRFTGSARVYDFRSPDKFSKEQIRTLQMIHDNFARQLGSHLSAYLRAPVQITCVHIEQGSFADFIQNIPTPSLISVLNMAPLPGRVLLATDAVTATIAVDRLLGGFGHAPEKTHEITDLEQTLMQGVMDYAIDGLQTAWKNVVSLRITLEEMALNAEFVQIALPSDAAVFLGFEVKIHDTIGLMTLCIPYAVLKPIVSELSPHTWVAGEARESGVYREALLAHVKKISVNVRVLLGEVDVEFQELLSLQAGDVLPLNSVAGRPLPVLIGNQAKYKGQPGLSGKQMAIQIMTGAEELNNG